MKRILAFIPAVFAVAFFSISAIAQSTGASASQAMFKELVEKDKVLFDSVFNTCNLNKLAELVTDDFEFYHDRAGQNANSGKQFVDSIAGACEKRKTGADVRLRRELVENSLEIYPLNNYGAIQMGVHRFYILSDGKEQLAEVAKFTHVWKKENGAWRLARVLSYDHKPAK
jgi:ketosteroid isomerase-like protein